MHAALSARMVALLHAQRPGDCQVYSSDLRVRVQATGLASYADATVVCGPVETDPDNADTVTNPTVLVEVLQPQYHRLRPGREGRPLRAHPVGAGAGVRVAGPAAGGSAGTRCRNVANGACWCRSECHRVCTRRSYRHRRAVRGGRRAMNAGTESVRHTAHARIRPRACVQLQRPT